MAAHRSSPTGENAPPRPALPLAHSRLAELALADVKAQHDHQRALDAMNEWERTTRKRKQSVVDREFAAARLGQQQSRAAQRITVIT